MDEDGESISVRSENKHEGIIELRIDEDNVYWITLLALDNVKGLGLGTACLQFHRKVFDATITAYDPANPTPREDGGHLTGDGPGFVRAMVKRGLVQASWT